MGTFNVTGRINWLNIEYNENTGGCRTKIILAEKKGSEYSSYHISFFNNRNDNIAERLAEFCKQGDYIRVNGNFKEIKYTPRNSDKPISQIEFTAWSFKKVAWDKESGKYVDVEISDTAYNG